MKLELDERALKAYIDQIIREEIEESRNRTTWWSPGTWGRSKAGKKWGYEWDPNLTKKQNIRNRKVNKAIIKQQGYKSHDEYEAGEGHALNQAQEQPQEEPKQQEQFPGEYPYKTNRQKTGQFQTWFNQNMGGRLVVDGIWGPRTEAAYQQWLSQANNLNESRKINEQAFKRLVKNTITEMFNK